MEFPKARRPKDGITRNIGLTLEWRSPVSAGADQAGSRQRDRRSALEHLRANADGGSIVNASTVGGVYGVANSIPYCASKGGLNTMTLMFARELAPKIRVNAIAPGFVDIDWWKAATITKP